MLISLTDFCAAVANHKIERVLLGKEPFKDAIPFSCVYAWVCVQQLRPSIMMPFCRNAAIGKAKAKRGLNGSSQRS